MKYLILLTKICNKCKEEKPLDSFYKRNTKHPFRWPCKACENSESREDYKSNPKKTKEEYAFKWRLQRYYGITPEQYHSQLLKQNNKCFICDKDVSFFKRRLAVDHNHHTGEITGLICTHCNRNIIGRNRDPKIFLRAFEYLSQGTGWFVPNEFLKGKKAKRNRKKNI